MGDLRDPSAILERTCADCGHGLRHQLIRGGRADGRLYLVDRNGSIYLLNET